ncbi:MAG: hypothetical protein K2L07_06105 [Lachnospiraceae bacterium]|nr:hypothetical protein [Lachnospiraceae bacterium]
MNAGTFHQTVTPILAIVATPDFKRRHDKQAAKRDQKKRMSFHSFNQTVELNDESIIHEISNCYGSNGKPIVTYASCFSKAL